MLNVNEHIPVAFVFALTLLAGAAWGAWHAFWITRLGVAPFVITLVTFIFAAGADEALVRGVGQVAQRVPVTNVRNSIRPKP